MGSVTLFQFVSLDGVTQGPGGPQEDTAGGFTKGGWVVPFFEEELGAYVDSVFQKAGAFLLGRKTYAAWAAHWPTIGPDDPDYSVAKPLNALPKHVGSRTMQPSDAKWQNSTLLGPDLSAELRGVRDSLGGELQVHGSCTFAQSLMREGLLDEFRLAVFPVVLGEGRKLFTEGLPVSLRLLESRTTPTGVQVLHYASGEPIQFGEHGT